MKAKANENAPAAIVNSRVATIVGEYLDYAKATHGKSQTDIGEALGLVKNGMYSNFLSLVKKGRCKLPDSKIEPFIRECGIQDGSELIDAILEEYYGTIFTIMKKSKRFSYNVSESTVMGAVLDAKREADEALRKSGLAAASNRSEQQVASNASVKWKIDSLALEKFKLYVKDNLLAK